ncbi:unnamed protein product [Rhodiola kirilowii]
MAMLAYQNPKISLNIEFDLRIADSWCLTEAMKIRNRASDGSLSKGKKRVHMRVSEAADSRVRRELLRISSSNFYLPNFVAEVQEVIKPVLLAYMKGMLKHRRSIAALK